MVGLCGSVQDVWQYVESEYDSLKTKQPPGQTEGASGQAFSAEKILTALKGPAMEIRNVCCNLAWTKPLAESLEGDKLSMSLIQKYAHSTFWCKQSNQPRAPQLWPAGVVIPIACMQREDLAPKTTWLRYGADVAVAGFWFAFATAKKMKLQEAEINSFRALARNVPMTFRYFSNEAERFAACTETFDQIESLREYFGLDLTRLVCVVQQAQKFVQADKLGQKVHNQDISDWLHKNVTWSDVKRCPSSNTVGQLLTIGNALAEAPKAVAAMALARATFGRDTLFDEYSKVLILVQKASGPKELEFLVEFLVVKLFRGSEAWSQAELKGKAGDTAFAIFVRKYADYLCGFLKDHGLAQNPRAHAIFFSPMSWREEFPFLSVPDLSWTMALSKPVLLALNHYRQVLNGDFNQDIKGLLGSPPAGGLQPAHAKECGNMKKFWAQFEDKIAIADKSRDAAGAEAETVATAAQSSEDKPESKDTIQKVQADAERMAEEMLSQQVMVLEQSSPAHMQLLAMLKAQDVCKSSSRHMAFYDPKNVAVCKVYPGHSKWQRYPVIVEADFKEFCKAANDLHLA